jgi:phosphotransferase system HPr-like phosphotransfer protein
VFSTTKQNGIRQRPAGCILAWAWKKTADVEIQWPSGLKQQLKSIAANQLVTVKESSGLG